MPAHIATAASTPRYPTAGPPAATDVVIAKAFDRRAGRRALSIIEVIGLIALLPIGIAVAALVVYVIKQLLT